MPFFFSDLFPLPQPPPMKGSETAVSKLEEEEATKQEVGNGKQSSLGLPSPLAVSSLADFSSERQEASTLNNIKLIT